MNVYKHVSMYKYLFIYIFIHSFMPSWHYILLYHHSHHRDNVTDPHGRSNLRSQFHSCSAQEGGPRSPQGRGGIGQKKILIQKSCIEVTFTSQNWPLSFKVPVLTTEYCTIFRPPKFKHVLFTGQFLLSNVWLTNPLRLMIFC